MNTEISKDKTECIPESALLEKIKMFETYRIEEIWSNEGDRSNQRQGSDFRKRLVICKNELSFPHFYFWFGLILIPRLIMFREKTKNILIDENTLFFVS